MSSEVTSFGAGRTPDIPDPSKIKNPSLRFAMTQLNFAEGLRTEAKTKMDEIAETQKKQKEANDYLDVFRKNQTDTATGNAEGVGGKYRKMTQEQLDWCKAHNIALPENVVKYGTNADVNDLGWDLICKGVQAHIDKIGADTQQKMVMAQDALGQYNAYTQGANSSVSSGNETFKYAARGQ